MNSFKRTDHFGIAVPDLDEAVAHLEKKGIRVLGSPTCNDPSRDNTEGSFKGIKCVYFRAPWGTTFELLEKPTD